MRGGGARWTVQQLSVYRDAAECASPVVLVSSGDARRNGVLHRRQDTPRWVPRREPPPAAVTRGRVAVRRWGDVSTQHPRTAGRSLLRSMMLFSFLLLQHKNRHSCTLKSMIVTAVRSPIWVDKHIYLCYWDVRRSCQTCFEMDRVKLPIFSIWFIHIIT